MRRRSAVITVALALGLALAGLVPSTATAASQPTKVKGWSTAPLTVSAGAAQSFRVTLVSRGHRSTHRRVKLQESQGGAWQTVDRARSDRHGKAKLHWTAPASGAPALRVTVARAGRSKGAHTPTRQVVVIGAGVSPTAAAVLALVNQARSQARSCDHNVTTLPAVPPLTLEPRLGAAAQKYAAVMVGQDPPSHDGPDGSNPQTRIEAEGYTWTALGENIAWGQPSPDAVMAAWLASEGHCNNIMSPNYTQLGVGYVASPGSKFTHYWVQDFGHP